MGMDRLSTNIVAILLAVWLPLFSGNVLAVSVAMQTTRGDCHAVMQTGSAHHDASMHQHMHQAVDLAQQQDHQNDHPKTSYNDCGVCQLACCGYMAAVVIEVARVEPAAQLFISAVTSFRSVFSAPLDPPPLALA